MTLGTSNTPGQASPSGLAGQQIMESKFVGAGVFQFGIFQEGCDYFVLLVLEILLLHFFLFVVKELKVGWVGRGRGLGRTWGREKIFSKYILIENCFK